ncbi:MAG: protein translocase subunit SecF [Candidatus Gracilibacteria bacterium]|nr:protein translocase subunit SecF [Candidatus Gracilibacteria bacterium]MDD2908584.1 protein translocase subunit SecF [Candidatus Gracilibacteria bacterium]
MKFNFISKRFGFYSFGIFTSLVAIIALLVLPLNLGIDMTGGVQIEYSFSKQIDIKAIVEPIALEIKKELLFNNQEAINNIATYKITGENKFVVEAGFNKLSKLEGQTLEDIKTSFKEKLSKKLGQINGNNVVLTKYVNIGESFGDYIKKTAYVTIIITILAISLYIAWAFRGSIEGFSSFPFAMVTMVSLAHDVLAALGFYLITSFFFPEFKVDTFFITAMLTVLGYSVSDTIVIMDRIRSNLKQKMTKKIEFGTLINNSINETLARSLFTSFAVFLTLLAMFFFGPVTIKGFILAMIYGTVFGTYSSIAIAAPMLYDFSGKK